MKEQEKVQFLNAPVSQTGIFGDAVESCAQQFSAAQKQTEAIKHIMRRRKPAAASTPAAAPQPARRRGRPRSHAARPSKFRGIRFTSVKPADAPVLRAEIAVLLAKDTIEPVPPADMRSGLFSPYFVVPKKGGGLRPILDLRVLNRALHKLPFKMLMQKRIFGCVRPLDWFAAIDLKDAYFHVSILPRDRPFLRFAFEGQAYQYKVLPFGLSLSPRVFTKVVEAALVPLREQGVRILNYLDDWLILAQSRKQLSAHRDLVLKHLSLLGLRVNWEKSKLVPTQRISFLESRGGRGNAALTGFRLHRPAARPSGRGQIPRSFGQECPWSRYPGMLWYSQMPRPQAGEPRTTATQYQEFGRVPNCIGISIASSC